MAAYLTWLDRDARQPFLPGEEFDEAVYDLEIDEPEGTDEPHAGDVRSAVGLPRASCAERGFVKASAREEVLAVRLDDGVVSRIQARLRRARRCSRCSTEAQRAELERNARERMSTAASRTISAGTRRSSSRGRRSRGRLATGAGAAPATSKCRASRPTATVASVRRLRRRRVADVQPRQPSGVARAAGVVDDVNRPGTGRRRELLGGRAAQLVGPTAPLRLAARILDEPAHAEPSLDSTSIEISMPTMRGSTATVCSLLLAG